MMAPSPASSALLPEGPFREETLVGILRWRARHEGDRPACTFLREGEEEEASWSFAELDRRARGIAARLRAEGAGGERVLLLFPSGLDFVAAFMGCLYAGAVAVPAHPPRGARSLPRLETILRDAGPRFLLSTAALLARMDEPPLRALRALAADLPEASPAAAREEPPLPSPDGLALLQYTSGSTSEPKGVMVAHRHLMANHRMLRDAFAQGAGSATVIWLPLFHDMGLIGNVLQGIFLGTHSILMAPEAFLVKPVRWLQAISRYRAEVSGGPNFAFEHCARRIAPEQKAALDLSRWAVAFNGAEPVRPATLERFAEAFAPCGFRREALYPCYGLAEATLFVTGGGRAAAPRVLTVDAAALAGGRTVSAAPGPGSRALAGSGHPWREGRVEIVQPESLLPCAPGEIGEIWVAGPHVAGGYRGLADETFSATLASSGDGPFLRTGDLGFMDEGELFVTGRRKELIIVAGRNHYPADLEQTAEGSHPALREGGAAAFAIEVEGEERVVLLAELRRVARAEVDEAAVERHVRQALAEGHGVGLHALRLLPPASLPRTTSGKPQRHLCRSTFLRGGFAPAAAAPPPLA